MALAITDDGVSLFWTEDGPADAPVLLLCNSVGSTVRMWAPQIEAFSARYRVIRHDARGHGRSDAPAADYTLERLALDALTVLDAAGAGRVHICGLSLGGMVAQQVALQSPDRLDRLVLANTAARIGAVDGWNQRIAAVREGGLEGIADMAIARFFSADFIAANPEAVTPVLEDLKATSPDGYNGACAALRDADVTERVGSITAPTLVIGGTGDVSTPPAQTQDLADRIPGARHYVLGAAHLSNIEQATTFTAAVLDHLES
jgi:3-oxoadipate enol-lactonase